MIAKQGKRQRPPATAASQPPSKNININISYNITVAKNNKHPLLDALIKDDKDIRSKRPSLGTATSSKSKPTSKLFLDSTAKEQGKTKGLRPDLSTFLDGGNISKPSKPFKKKKGQTVCLRTTEQQKIVKLKTQQAPVSKILEVPPVRHRRVMSRDRVDNRGKLKSCENTGRNRSDGSKKLSYGDKQVRKKRRRQASGDLESSPMYRKRAGVSFNEKRVDKLKKRRKTQTLKPSRSSKSPPGQLLETFPNESLVEKLIRTEISSVGIQPTQSSPLVKSVKSKPHYRDINMAASMWQAKPQTTKHSNTPIQPIRHQRKACLGDLLKAEAATKIQRAWRNYQGRKVINFYSSMFSRNCAQTKQVSILQKQKIESPKPLLTTQLQTSLCEQVYQLKRQFPSEKNNPILALEQYKNSSREQSECQSDFQFNIRKYEDIVERSLLEDMDKKHKSSVEESEPPKHFRDSFQEIEYFKAHQLQQWNRINAMINQQIENKSQHEHLLQELIKHSEMNKKWIEAQQSPHSKQNNSINMYKGLSEEKGIGGRLKNRSGSQKKCVETILAEEWGGTLSSTSSKKHPPQVYLNSPSPVTPNHKSNQQLDSFCPLDSYLDCNIKKLPQSNSNTPTDNKHRLQSPSNLSKIEDIRRKITNTILYSEQNLPEVESQEEDAQEIAIDLKPRIENDWKKLSLQGVTLKKQYENLKSLSHKDMLRQDELNKFMRRQLFSKQAVFEAIVNQELLLACEQVSKLQSSRRQRLNASTKAQKPRKNKNGIKTDFSQVKLFINSFIQYVQEEMPKPTLEIVLRNLNTPLGPNSKQVLEYLSLRQFNAESTNSIDSSNNSEYIINIESFHSYQISHTDPALNQRAQAYTYYWHRAIFEALNQTLDQFRPYGIFGQPYAWQTDARVFKRVTTTVQLKTVLLEAADRVYSHATILAGILFDKDDSPFTDGQILQQTKRQVNQQRLSRMLGQVLMQQQPTYTNYKDQTAQLAIQLWFAIADNIFREAATDIFRIVV